MSADILNRDRANVSDGVHTMNKKKDVLKGLCRKERVLVYFNMDKGEDQDVTSEDPTLNSFEWTKRTKDLMSFFSVQFF